MLRIKPVNVEVFDTWEMAEEKFPNRKNNLKTLCNRLGIKWDNKESHRATYDVYKGIEVFIKMKGESKEEQQTNFLD